MYCKYCGKEIAENAEKCKYCGAPAEGAASDKARKKFNVFSLLGLIFAIIGVVNGIISVSFNDVSEFAVSFLVLIIAGLVLSIIGTVKSKKYRTGKVAGILGIIISSLALILYVGFFLLIVIIFTGLGQALQAF